jgi:hypothetical protein
VTTENRAPPARAPGHGFREVCALGDAPLLRSRRSNAACRARCDRCCCGRLRQPLPTSGRRLLACHRAGVRADGAARPVVVLEASVRSGQSLCERKRKRKTAGSPRPPASARVSQGQGATALVPPRFPQRVAGTGSQGPAGNPFWLCARDPRLPSGGGRDSNPRWTVRPTTVFERRARLQEIPLWERVCGLSKRGALHNALH